MTSVHARRFVSQYPSIVSFALLSIATLALLAAVPNRASGQAAKVYWTDFGPTKVQRADVDGSNVESIVTNPSIQPFEIDVDVTNAHLYWTETTGAKIQRSNMDGSGVVDVVTGLDTPRGLAVDNVNGKVYWTDWGTLKIQRSNLDGSNVEDLVTTGLSIPRGIVLDVASSKMYWTDSGTSKIQRADLDGSNIEDLITTGLNTTVGIAVDPAGGKMYWTDQLTATIHRSNLDGSSPQTIVSTGLLDPSYISLDEVAGKIYWTDFGTSWLQSANLDGSSVSNVVTAGLIIPTGVALAPSAALPVELSSLTAHVDRNDIRISWQTASETDASGFEVQEKAGEIWKPAGFVQAVGSVGTATEYDFVLENKDPGVYGIRLRLIDLDGSFTYSSIVEVSIDTAGLLTLSEPYPNPSSKQASFTIASARSQTVHVVLYDMQGREVAALYSGALDSNSALPLSIQAGDLANGIYMLHVRGETVVATRRVAVVR